MVALTECQCREQYISQCTPPEKKLLLRLIEWCLQEYPSSRPPSAIITKELAKIREETKKGLTGETVRC